jgi:hypothetical protein
MMKQRQAKEHPKARQRGAESTERGRGNSLVLSSFSLLISYHTLARKQIPPNLWGRKGVSCISLPGPVQYQSIKLHHNEASNSSGNIFPTFLWRTQIHSD